MEAQGFKILTQGLELHSSRKRSERLVLTDTGLIPSQEQ